MRSIFNCYSRSAHCLTSRSKFGWTCPYIAGLAQSTISLHQTLERELLYREYTENNDENINMCLERPLEQAVSESPVSMTDYVEKGYDFDFKYGQRKDHLEELKAPTRSSSPRAKRKHHRRKLKGKKKFRLPSTFFEPMLEKIDEEKEVEIDPLRLVRVKDKKMSSKHRERALENGTSSPTDDGRRFRHRHFIKREKATT